MKFLSIPSAEQVRQAVQADPNVRNFVKHAKHYAPQLPSQTAHYLRSKVPIIEWLPRYSTSWLVNDIVAGITIGVLLVPQSLSYATVANIPAHYGLVSSWLPTLFYAIMGTSKDVTAGPTAIMGLLTGEIVSDLTKEGYSAIAIANAAAFWTGIYALALGVLRLGFLLDFIPLPVLSGYVSGAAITIIIQQLKALFGEQVSGNSTANKIRAFFVGLPTTNWRAFLISFAGIILLVGMQQLGRKLGKRHRIFWFIGIARNAVALVLFTLISWGVNKDRKKKPLFGISKVTGAGIVAPHGMDTELLVKVAGRSVAVFAAAALEHLAIGRAFGRRHGYEIDEDQELTYIGVVNLFGSFFGCMPVTGGFSRTAVNSESGVKTPLAGVLTSACVLVSIYKLTGAFYWIPNATLAVVIVVAVWQIVLPARVFWHYWKTSLADFIGSMVAFWVTLFVDVEIGIAAAVGYSIVYVLLQLAFTRVTLVDETNVDRLYPQSNESVVLGEDSMVLVLQDAILYPNAKRVARQICEYLYTYSAPTEDSSNDTTSSKDRLWNDTRRSLISSLRKQAGIAHDADLRHVRVLVLDMTRVAHIDTTGMQALADIRSTLIEWSGEQAELRFIGLNDELRERFFRAQEIYELCRSTEEPLDGGHVVFDVLQSALRDRTVEKTVDQVKGGSSV